VVKPIGKAAKGEASGLANVRNTSTLKGWCLAKRGEKWVKKENLKHFPLDRGIEMKEGAANARSESGGGLTRIKIGK